MHKNWRAYRATILPCNLVAFAPQSAFRLRLVETAETLSLPLWKFARTDPYGARCRAPPSPPLSPRATTSSANFRLCHLYFRLRPRPSPSPCTVPGKSEAPFCVTFFLEVRHHGDLFNLPYSARFRFRCGFNQSSFEAST